MSKLLLDTHTFIWISSQAPELPRGVLLAIMDSSTPRFVSVVSAWEIALKSALGKLELNMPIEDLFGPALAEFGIEMIGVEISEVSRYHALGRPKAHRDPFDRMLVAQALQRELTLVSRDEALDSYGVRRLWG